METAKRKGLTLEQFINESQEYGYSKLKVPLGINGTAVYPPNQSVIVKNGDLYVPGMEVMTGFNYNDRQIKAGKDYALKKEYNVPDAPIGWWASEKFDGQRAVWDGQKFVSRNSSGDPRVYPYVPRWFMACMPPGIALDGELFLARNSFSATTSILKTGLKPERIRKKGDPTQQDLDARWSKIKYQVFDVINGDPYEQRKLQLESIVAERDAAWTFISVPFYIKKPICPLVLTQQYLLKSVEQLDQMYDSLVAVDAEGVMVRAPGIPYIPRRTKLMLKIKLKEDSDCILIGFKPGEGKYQGMLGSFECQDNVSKKTFYLGGMNDKVRQNYNNPGSPDYHPVGTLITYTFNGKTADGIPRHPRYKGIRND
jgi:DNA ligase-1